MTDQLRGEDTANPTDAVRQASEIDRDQVDDAPEASGAISTTPVDGGGDSDPDQWADQMADGEDFDESMGEPADDDRVLATDELDEIDDDDAPEGSEARDEEFEGDDPADIPDEHGGTQAGVDTDDNGVDDTVLPEGTDRIVDTGDDDWE
ncbi:hypothetical protein FQ330_09675 [Agrococcus sediminis]|uniref:Uncharacterized protein n=1 Tax=Agrococcus sediminis TaxID=2599924 RepID=A0A5M8QA91_9MICO|nr:MULTISPECIES: hypothetical protein [Agrococcus]KAA6432043.1 hypothetical protein FQ330_09675 [Agrococcus sediminis]MDR7233082.1 hypothetical protein [Agrococcus sp. BE272]RWR17333.1 hypothetical protein D8Y24_12200 [Agrococcus lahaulensis]UOV99945.1 hypothetical protein MU522_08290 [Agrococcus sp. SCSIO52902]